MDLNKINPVPLAAPVVTPPKCGCGEVMSDWRENGKLVRWVCLNCDARIEVTAPVPDAAVSQTEWTTDSPFSDGWTEEESQDRYEAALSNPNPLCPKGTAGPSAAPVVTERKTSRPLEDFIGACPNLLGDQEEPDAVVTHEPNCGCPTCAPWEPDAIVSQPEGTLPLLKWELRNGALWACTEETEQGLRWRPIASAELMRELILSPVREFAKASPTPVVSGQADGWIRVEDGLPKIGAWVLVICNGHVQRQAATLQWADIFMPNHGDPKCWVWADESADSAPLEEVTHWQPLPAPPSLPKAGETDEIDPHEPDCECSGDSDSEGNPVIHSVDCKNCDCGAATRQAAVNPLGEPAKDRFGLSREALELCWEIEKLPASEQQTKVSIMASNLHSHLVTMFAAPPLLPATDSAMVKCFKVTRPDFGKKFCVYRDLQTIVDAEFDGSEVGDGVLIEIIEMTDAELRALPDFEGW